MTARPQPLDAGGLAARASPRRTRCLGGFFDFMTCLLPPRLRTATHRPGGASRGSGVDHRRTRLSYSNWPPEQEESVGGFESRRSSRRSEHPASMDAGRKGLRPAGHQSRRPCEGSDRRTPRHRRAACRSDGSRRPTPRGSPIRRSVWSARLVPGGVNGALPSPTCTRIGRGSTIECRNSDRSRTPGRATSWELARGERGTNRR